MRPPRMCGRRGWLRGNERWAGKKSPGERSWLFGFPRKREWGRVLTRVPHRRPGVMGAGPSMQNPAAWWVGRSGTVDSCVDARAPPQLVVQLPCSRGLVSCAFPRKLRRLLETLMDLCLAVVDHSR